MKDNSVHTVCIGLGTNLGNRMQNLVNSYKLIQELGCKIILSSSVYESDPWGYQSKNSFYNQCLVIETLLSPIELLHSFKEIERDFGRTKRSVDYEDRPIDIDILFYDDLLLDGRELTIPHPGIAQRNFVLIPLLEILPEKIHPLLKQSISDLSMRCVDRQEVRLLAHK